MIEHVPAPTIVTVEPDTVHTLELFDANPISKPDDAVAARPTVPSGANVVSDGSVKSID